MMVMVVGTEATLNTTGFCLPVDLHAGVACWPTPSAVAAWKASLGDAARWSQAGMPEYSLDVAAGNAYFRRHPWVVVFAASTSDIVRVVEFAYEHRLRLVVRNGRHSYPGRSVADDGVLLDVSRLNDVVVDASAEDAKVVAGGGCLWADLYDAAAEHGLVVVGGHDPTVGVVGLTSGGGHGALSRLYGLAADNLLAAKVVLANGTVVEANATSHTDLLWALRGGGPASSFGVVFEVTVRAHKAPASVTGVSFSAPIVAWNTTSSAYEPVMALLMERFFHNRTFHESLDRRWGGWMGIGGSPLSAEAVEYKVYGHVGVSWVFSGPLKEAMPLIDELRAYRPDWQALRWVHIFEQNYTSYAEYATATADPGNFEPVFIMNVFAGSTQQMTSLDKIMPEMMYAALKQESSLSLVYNMVFGGAAGPATDPHNTATAVSPGFRQALVEVVTVAAWEDPRTAPDRITYMVDATQPLVDGFPSTYLNEWTASSTQNNFADWKTRFWSEDIYARLLTVKRAYDPCNRLVVLKGVGSDLSRACYCIVHY